MKTLAGLAINRTRTTVGLMVLALIWGAVSWVQIPKQAEPEVAIPFVSVTTIINGVSPEDVERLVTRPIEERISNDVDDIVSLRGYSSLGVSSVAVEFPAAFDQDLALRDVQQAVEDSKADLPQDAQDPIVREFNNSDFPLMRVAVTSKSVPPRTLIAVAKELQNALEQIPEVLEVNLTGVPDEVLEIEIDPILIQSYGLRIADVYNAVRNSNTVVPTGYQDTGLGRFSIKVPPALVDAESLQNLPLKFSDGRAVLLGQVAQIRPTYKFGQSYSKINGKFAYSLEIVKKADENDIDTAENVYTVLGLFSSKLPSGIQVELIQDDSEWARSMVQELQGNIGTSIWLVMMLVIATMGFRAGFLVGMSIPFSFLVGFIVLQALDLAFNFMVMFGLLLSIGMLIDGAIVIVEHANRSMRSGMEAAPAYIRASKTMFWPIVSSAATTLAAFIPLIVWPGVTGEFMKYLPITVFSVLSAALAYSLVLVPVIGSLLGKTKSLNQQVVTEKEVEQKELELLNKRRPYTDMLYWLCKYPVTTLLSVCIFLVAICTVYIRFGPGTSYFVHVDEVYGQVFVRGLANFSTDEKLRIAEEVESVILANPHLKTSYLGVGQAAGYDFPGSSGNSGASAIGNFFIELKGATDRQPGLDGVVPTGGQVFEQIRQEANKLPGIEILVEPLASGPPAGKSLELDVLGQNREDVRQVTEALTDYLKNYSLAKITDVENTLPQPLLEWVVDINRERAGVLGVDFSEVTALLLMATVGAKVDEYLPTTTDEEVDILVRFPQSQRTLDRLTDLTIYTRDGAVPLSSIVERIPSNGYNSYGRKNSLMYSNLSADVEDTMVPLVLKDLLVWGAESEQVPTGVQVVQSGRSKEINDTVAFLSLAGTVAMFLMLIILVTQFNSYYQAFVTLLAVLMSIAGVFIMMLLTGRVMSVVMDGMGLVTLAGVVVNNNIVLIDTFNNMRRKYGSLSTIDVAVLTARMRLRPVVLTTATTVFGLLPMVMGISVDLFSRSISSDSRAGQYWENLATTVASGLTFSTILTLIVTPVALTIPSYLKGLDFRISSLWRKVDKGDELAPDGLFQDSAAGLGNH